MALQWIDRAKESTTTTGVGAVSLGGAVTAAYQAFSVGMSNGDTVYICIEQVDTNGVPTGNWEISLATYASGGNTLTRTTVLASSNSGSAVNFTAGTKYVFSDFPANRILKTVFSDAANVLNYSVIQQEAATTLLGNPTGSPANVSEVIPSQGLGFSGSNLVNLASNGWFGDGSDGALVFDGSTTILGMVPSANVYTLTRNIFATNL